MRPPCVLRLEQQGGVRFYGRGEADERTGSAAIEPWVAGVWPALRAAIVSSRDN